MRVASMSVGIVQHSMLDGHELACAAQRFEALGLAAIWVNENTHSGVPHLDPFVTLATIAAHTKDVVIGTAVALLAMRPPIEQARTVASIDILSGGRVVFGVGSGGATNRGFTAYGVDPAERGRRVDEALDVIDRLWTGEAVSWQGEFFRLDEYSMATAPRQVLGPPVWVGGASPQVVRRAARRADGFLPIGRGPDESAELHRRVLEERRFQGLPDRPLTRAAYVYVGLADDPQDAVDVVRTELSARYARDVAPFVPGVNAALGTPEQCQEFLTAFEERGFEHLVLDLSCADEQKEGQFEALIADVAGPWLGNVLSARGGA